MAAPSDTSAAADQVLVEGFRGMSPTEKIHRVAAMNRAVEQLATARLRTQYGDLSEGELRLRLAALRLDADIMRDVFAWDPRVRGL